MASCFYLIGQIGSVLKTGGAIVAQTKSVSSEAPVSLRSVVHALFLGIRLRALLTLFLEESLDEPSLALG